MKNSSFIVDLEPSDNDAVHDACGVFGVYLNHPADVARLAYYAGFALQHRGQEACGIAVNANGIMTGYKDVGIIDHVFSKDVLDAFDKGTMALAHCLYGKKISVSRSTAQPMMVNHAKGATALAMNGVILNASSIRKELEANGVIFHSLSESEVLAAYIVKNRLNTHSIEEALIETMKHVTGVYSLVLMSPKKLLAARDPKGLRPLCLGKLDDGYVVASESCAIVAVGGAFIRDIEPGEVIVIQDGEIKSYRLNDDKEKRALCAFEFIYFARPDSVVDGASIHEVRLNLGRLLAKAHPVEADVVIGVPDSGLNGAMGYSLESGISLGMGFLKNKYIGRSFIAPEVEERERLVRIKLNTIGSVVKDKRVIVVDDSIVRGVTSERFIRILREAGAKELHVRSTAPPFINACYYGTDIDSPETLISNNHSPEEIAHMIGADSVAILPIEDLEKAVLPYSGGLCDACFTNRFPIDPSPSFMPMAERIARPLRA